MKIHMTYKKPIPTKVFERWLHLNPTCNVDFSLDNECYDFLKNEYNLEVANLFTSIPKGCHKADLWRLFKLYKNGGVYADVDLVPYVVLHKFDPTIFYSCMAINNKSIFQAFMMTPPKNPLILCFMISFLFNHPYREIYGPTGPCVDMYNAIKYNTGSLSLESEKNYAIKNVKIPIPVPPNVNHVTQINLGYFPSDVIPTFRMNTPIPFDIKIENSILYIEKKDGRGWSKKYTCEIILSQAKVYLFKENGRFPYCTVVNKNEKMFDSRDPQYFKNNGW